jgi:hypothetical protein
MNSRAEDAYNVAKHCGCRVSHLEKDILTSPYYAAHYAKDIIKAPWPIAEPVIAQNGLCSTMYAELVLGSKFESGEPAIAQDASAARIYAETVISDRWKPGEYAIAQDAMQSLLYASFLGERWEPGEDAIAQSPSVALVYSITILKGRFYQAELALYSSVQFKEYVEQWFGEPVVTRDQVDEYEWSCTAALGYLAPARWFSRKASIIDTMLDIPNETVL